MLSKSPLDQLKLAKTVSVYICQKRKSEASLVLNAYPKIKDNKLNTSDTSDRKDKSKTWFWNKNANESNLNKEEEEENNKNK